MEYNLNNLLNFSNLATGPFCLDEDNTCNVSNLLLCDSYFNGLNSVGLGETFNLANKVSKEVPVDNNIGFGSGDLSKESYTLDYFLEDGLVTSLQQSDDGIFDNINIATPLLSDTSDNDVFSSDGVSPSHSSTSSISTVDDLSFELLETLDTDETVIERKQDSCDVLQFDFMHTPLSSSDTNSSDEGISDNLINFLEMGNNDNNSPSDMGLDHVDLKLGEMQDTETFINSLSPKSVDSGISMASSASENSPMFEEMPVDLVDFFSMSNSHPPHQIQNLPPMETWQINSSNHARTSLIPGNQIADILSPKSVDSDISISSDENSYDSDNYYSNQSNVLSLQNSTPSQSVLTEFVDFSKSDSQPENGRYSPYKKGKQKTPEQKLRKKTQNRSAATRYRSKKKEEFGSIFAEANKLEEQNKELKDKVDGLRNEIDYLKSLMLDVINARLSKKKNDLVGLGGLLQSV